MTRIPKNYLLAGVIALVVALWMLSGVIWRDTPVVAPDGAADGAPAAFRVEVAAIAVETIQRRIVAQGQVKPERYATLKAQTGGQVESVLVDSGQRVKSGELLVRLAMDDREARRTEALAVLQQRRREHEAAQRLGQSGLQSEVRQEEVAAALAAAEAVLRRVELEIAHTGITAPFDGIIDEVMVEKGDFAAVQTPVATVVDNSPLIAEAFLSQRHFDAVQPGADALVTLVSGQTHPGNVTTIAPRADPSSRTFRVEIEIDNPRGVPANTSAEIIIPTGAVDAHRLSPALLELDDEGRLGVKTVSEDGHVAFMQVEIARTDPQGVWVTGLPKRVRVITTGGGFVSPGQQVEAVDANRNN